MRDFARGPLRSVITYPGYYVNGYKFHTIGHGSSRSTMNSGVCIKGTNYSANESDYYGLLEEVVQLEYPGLPVKRTVLFKCQWFDPSNMGTRVHPDYKLVDVNHKRRFNRYEPFVLALQASQVYYSTYPTIARSKPDWWAVCKIKPRSNVEVPKSANTNQQSAISPPFQEEELENHEPVRIDEDPGYLDDPEGRVIEMDDQDVESDTEDELQSEDDTEEEEPISEESARDSDSDS